MSVLPTFFRPHAHSEIALLIDIGADSIAAGYVRYVDAELPIVLYTCHVIIDIRDGESHDASMLRALGELVATLLREGMPALVRIAGTDLVQGLFISIDAPWQETKVRVEELLEEKGFVFTKRLVADTIQKATPPTPGKIFSDVSIIGTILDGYDTHDPYGKRVHRASLIFLTSSLTESIAESIRAAVHPLKIKQPPILIAATSVRYQAIRIAFPHEHDVLILDATGRVTTVALVRKNMLVAISEAPESLAQSGARAEEFMHCFTDIATQYPLPHTILLLVRDADAASFEKLISTLNVSALWFSDAPPTVTMVLASHLSGLVRQMSMVPPDLPLFLAALYYGRRGRSLWGNAH